VTVKGRNVGAQNTGWPRRLAGHLALAYVPARPGPGPGPGVAAARVPASSPLPLLALTHPSTQRLGLPGAASPVLWLACTPSPQSPHQLGPASGRTCQCQ
jgi:hypothetical protein